MIILQKLKCAVPLAPLAFVLALFSAGCSETTNTSVKPIHEPNSYIIPSTIATFDAGLIHNEELFYIFSHYDTVKYASYPNKFSQHAVDSLATLFIADSLQSSTGPYTPAEITRGEVIFDSAFDSLTQSPTHGTLVVAVDSLEAQGYLASDEGNFIINADTDLRLCTSYSQTNDSISSLKSQYNSITWASSTSNGATAYEYLSIADSSCHFWGGPSGHGGAGDPVPIAAKPIEDDNAGYVIGLEVGNAEKASGMDVDPVLVAMEYAAAASAQGGTGNGGHGGGGGGGGGGGIIILVPVIVFILVMFIAFL